MPPHMRIFLHHQNTSLSHKRALSLQQTSPIFAAKEPCFCRALLQTRPLFLIYNTLYVNLSSSYSVRCLAATVSLPVCVYICVCLSSVLSLSPSLSRALSLSVVKRNIPVCVCVCVCVRVCIISLSLSPYLSWARSLFFSLSLSLSLSAAAAVEHPALAAPFTHAGYYTTA